MTDQPQSCRECRHFCESRYHGTVCHWAEKHDLVYPYWAQKPMPVDVSKAEDCPAFEPKDDADDA